MMRATVLAYHAVGDCDPGDDPHNLWVSTAAFQRQMAQLRRRRRVIALHDLVAGRIPPGPPAVAITFDDAYRSIVRNAVPVLHRHGFPATVFLPTAFLGDRNRWNPPQPCDVSIIDAGTARELEGAGLQVESHGHEHLDLRISDDATTRRDLMMSRRVLTDTLGRPPRYLAWPFRDGSDAARRIAQEVGFETAFSIDLPHGGRYAFARVQVTPLDSDRAFWLKTSGCWPLLRHHPIPATGYRLVKQLLPARRK